MSWNILNSKYTAIMKKVDLNSKDINMPNAGYDKEKMFELEKELSLVKQSQSIMQRELSEIKEDVKNIDKKLDTIVDKLSDKFASKRVESAMKWLITAICWWVVTAVLAIVLK